MFFYSSTFCITSKRNASISIGLPFLYPLSSRILYCREKESGIQRSCHLVFSMYLVSLIIPDEKLLFLDPCFYCRFGGHVLALYNFALHNAAIECSLARSSSVCTKIQTLVNTMFYMENRGNRLFIAVHRTGHHLQPSPATQRRPSPNRRSRRSCHGHRAAWRTRAHSQPGPGAGAGCLQFRRFKISART